MPEAAASCPSSRDPGFLPVAIAGAATLGLYLATSPAIDSLRKYRPHAACVSTGLFLALVVAWATVCVFRRRWPQFSMRALLAIVVCAGVNSGWMGAEIQRWQRQEAALDAFGRARPTKGLPPWGIAPRPAPLPLEVERVSDWLGIPFFAEPERADVRYQVDAKLLLDFPELRVLQFEHGVVMAKDIPAIRGLRKLQSLSITGASLRDDELLEIASLPSVVDLELSFPQSSRPRLAALLDRMPRLQSLSLENVEVNADAAQAIGRMSGLWWLSLHRCKIAPDAYGHLAGARKLRSLRVYSSELDNNNLAAFSDMPMLEDLSLLNLDLDKTGLAHLSRLPNLRVLEVRRLVPSDDAIAILGRFPALESVVPSTKYAVDKHMSQVDAVYVQPSPSFPPRPRSKVRHD